MLLGNTARTHVQGTALLHLMCKAAQLGGADGENREPLVRTPAFLHDSKQHSGSVLEASEALQVSLCSAKQVTQKPSLT